MSQPVALQLVHGLLPAKGIFSPLTMENDVKGDNIRSAPLLQFGQEASSPDLLNERNNSNFSWQSVHTYS